MWRRIANLRHFCYIASNEKSISDRGFVSSDSINRELGLGSGAERAGFA